MGTMLTMPLMYLELLLNHSIFILLFPLFQGSTVSREASDKEKVRFISSAVTAAVVMGQK